MWGESESRGAPWDGEKLSLYIPFLTAGNALLALAETTVGRIGPMSWANGDPTMSLHTYDLGGHTVGVRLGKIPATWREGGREEVTPWTPSAYHGR